MKIVLCAAVIPEQYENKIASLSIAGNRFVLNMSDELKKQNKVKILSYLAISLKESDIREFAKLPPKNVFYVDKSGLKLKSVLQYMFLMMHWIKRADCLITYNAVYAWLAAPCLARMAGKKSVLIFADYSAPDACRGILRKIYALLQLQAVRQYDIVIGLSKETKRYLKRGQKFLCMEGGISRRLYDRFSEYKKKDGNDIIFLYAGTLEPVTGIDLLLDAFDGLSGHQFQLWISGKGSLLETVKGAAKKDGRIRYLGCPCYKEYLNNLERADILINPRNMALPENRNNFPSKIMEYLATGKEIISTKFPGWEKFRQYMEFCGSSPDELLACMKCLAGYKPDIIKWKQKRIFAREFLWKNQIKKMMDVIGNLDSDLSHVGGGR